MQLIAETLRNPSGSVHAYRAEVVGQRGTRLTVYLWPRMLTREMLFRRLLKRRLPIDVFYNATGIWLWLVGLLPRRLAYWVGIRMWGEATSGEYGSTVVTDVTMDEVMRRWRKGARW